MAKTFHESLTHAIRHAFLWFLAADICPEYHFFVAFCSLYNSLTEEIRNAMNIKQRFIHTSG